MKVYELHYRVKRMIMLSGRWKWGSRRVAWLDAKNKKAAMKEARDIERKHKVKLVRLTQTIHRW